MDLREFFGGLGVGPGLALLLMAVVWLVYGSFSLGQRLKNNRKGNDHSFGANQVEALFQQMNQSQRDLVHEIRREREALSKELEDAVTRLALEITQERKRK